MNAQGDARNTAWKRRAEKGDVILKRGPKGVLVTNESSGIWQITKETLRYAHRLFLKDKRDYTKLPEHLRPPRDLNLNDVPPAVLTTYAGLFLSRSAGPFRGKRATGGWCIQRWAGKPEPEVRGGCSYGRPARANGSRTCGGPARPVGYRNALHNFRSMTQMHAASSAVSVKLRSSALSATPFCLRANRKLTPCRLCKMRARD